MSQNKSNTSDILLLNEKKSKVYPTIFTDLDGELGFTYTCLNCNKDVYHKFQFTMEKYKEMEKNKEPLVMGRMTDCCFKEMLCIFIE